MYKIYKYENKYNGKKYIGITRRSIEQRWKEHTRKDRSYKFQKAIKKYGDESWNLEILEENASEEEVLKKEEYWISFYDSVKNGYNTLNKGSKPPKYKNQFDFPIVAIHISEKRPIYFNSIRQCSRVLNVDRKAISNIINGDYHTYNNYTFVKEEDFELYSINLILEKIPIKKNIGERKVEAFNLETGETLKIFEKIKDGSKYFKTSHSHISSVCLGKRNYSGKYNEIKIGWKYL